MPDSIMNRVQEILEAHQIPLRSGAADRFHDSQRKASGVRGDREWHERRIIIGTHALIQEEVQYRQVWRWWLRMNSTGLVCVRGRSLADKGITPHVLVMSATPIPRTLAIIVYGDLDISVMDEMPANRLPIKNCVVDESAIDRMLIAFMEKEVAAGHQVYIICPMVEESE